MHPVFALLLLAPTLDAAPTVKPTVKTIEWSVRGLSHAVRVKEDAQDLKLIDRPHAWLRSVVGPMVSTLHNEDHVADNGGYRNRWISVEIQGAYDFDLTKYIDKSRQAGAVMRQLLESRSVALLDDGELDPPTLKTESPCPTADAIASWDGGFAALAQVLVSSECVGEDAVKVEAAAFWIDAWDGERVTLALQRDHCKNDRSVCTGAYTYVAIKPPELWTPWLEAASQGEGYLPKLSVSETNEGEPTENAVTKLPGLPASP